MSSFSTIKTFSFKSVFTNALGMSNVLLAAWRVWAQQICAHYLTSFVLDLVAMPVFRLNLLMIVIMKALLSLYNIDLLAFTKLRIRRSCASSKMLPRVDSFFCTSMPFFFENKYRPWQPPAPPPASLWPIGSNHGFLESSWPPLATAEGPVAMVQGDGLQNISQST